MFRHWRESLLSGFADREDVGKASAYRQYWAQLPEQDVMELFELLQMEYQLPPGLLRPTDKVEKLLIPVTTANPLKWLVYRARTEDRITEINYRLGKRQQRRGTQRAWQETGIVA